MTEKKKIFKNPRPAERHPELESTLSLHPLPEQISVNRSVMYLGHLTQALPSRSATRPSIITGQEFEFAKAEFDVRIPQMPGVDENYPDGVKILKVIPRFPKNRMGKASFSENPQTIIIFEYDELVDSNTGEHRKVIDYIDAMSYHHLHQEFGFLFKYDYHDLQKLEGEYLPQGERIAGSPSVDEDGFWRYGVEANVAMMSIPQITEDGVVASRGFCERNQVTGVKRFIVSYGKSEFPINLYGNSGEYKPHPDIGEHVRNDGLLFALRPYEDELFPVYVSPETIGEVNSKQDTCYYAQPGARVIDVRVEHDSRLRTASKETKLTTPDFIRAQDENYWYAQVQFYQQIVDYYHKICGYGHHSAPYLSPRMRSLVAKAMANAKEINDPNNRLNTRRKYRNREIDEWQIEITVAYPIQPSEAFKLTDISGGKGVITEVWEDEDMPVDQAGNRAEIIVDGLSTIKRMNPSRLTEQYIKASARDTHQRLVEMSRSGVSRPKIKNTLYRFYELACPEMLEFDSILDDKGTIATRHLDSVLNSGITVYMPTNKTREPLEIVQDLRREFPPVHSKVSYRNQRGCHVTTKDNVLIGPMYIMLLERTGKSWSAVASARLSHFGMPTKLTANDRDNTPVRQTPVRFGEDECRLFMATIGSKQAARFYNRTANPVVRKVIQENILKSEKPSAIDATYSREDYPSGNTRVASIIRHFAECCGWAFTRKIKG